MDQRRLISVTDRGPVREPATTVDDLATGHPSGRSGDWPLPGTDGKPATPVDTLPIGPASGRSGDWPLLVRLYYGQFPTGT